MATKEELQAQKEHIVNRALLWVAFPGSESIRELVKAVETLHELQQPTTVPDVVKAIRGWAMDRWGISWGDPVTGRGRSLARILDRMEKHSCG